VHNSYYFLRLIARLLDVRLRDFRLVSCFSQTRDELVIEFHKDKTHIFLRATLLPELTSISFPTGVKRARKNSVDLFPELILLKVKGAQSYENDRSFRINLEGGHGLLVKMHGNRANVLHTDGERVKEVFRKNITADIELVPSELEKKINWSTVTRADIFTFTKEVWSYLDEHGFGRLTPDEQRSMIATTKQKLESPTEFFHIDSGDHFVFSLLPYNSIAAKFDDPFLAVTAFVAAYSSRQAFQQEKRRLISRLNERIARADAYLKKTKEHLSQLSTDQHFQQWADILMANLDKVQAGEKSVTLANFYQHDNLTQIRLNPSLSPQKNAEAYYRKAKNRVIELNKTRELLIAKEMELLKLNQLLIKAEATDSLAGVRSLTEPDTLAHDNKARRLPYREIIFEGFRIWIGRDAKDNDELTLHFGNKEDLWLHVKDASGSHVLVKHQAGKIFPKSVTERAAELAAFYSKRKTEGLCPVAYTARKYVRKRKGDPAGMVVVEREKVILVEPKGL
jgi:predicted ribosome quality control (RQC) complex YloA/Tae2 family protein